MSQSIYDQLVAIANTYIEKKSKLFSSYQEDLYKFDYDILKHDSQAGDVYIWEIKANGCGTNLTRCVGEDTHIYQSEKDGDFFKVTCNDINSGTVTRLKDRADVLDVIASVKPNKNRVPRRKLILDALADQIGLESSKPLRSNPIVSDFNPHPGEMVIFKTVKGQAMSIRVDIARTQRKDWNGGSDPIEKSYLIASDLNAYMNHKEEPEYFRFKCTQEGYGETTKCTRRVYDNAVKKIESIKQKGFEPVSEATY